jgi:hypothetical protein
LTLDDDVEELEVGAAEDVLVVELEVVVGCLPQLDGSMPLGQHEPSAKQKEPLGHDQDAEQHCWPASGL